MENYSELEQSEKTGLKVDVIETIDKTTFFIPDEVLIRINPATNKDRTTMYFYDEAYSIDIDYETVRQMIRDAIRNGAIN